MPTFSPFLGKGTKYPFSFDSVTGGVMRASSENYYPGNPQVQGESLEKINSAIEFILSVALGTRFFMPDFGSNLHRLLFEPNDDILADSLRVFISEALNKWEKRISLLSIDVVTTKDELNQHIARVIINYKVVSSQQIGNYVYPFVRRI